MLKILCTNMNACTKTYRVKDVRILENKTDITDNFL